MNRVISRAPGEIFFFGEHSVVYGRRAIAAAIERWVTTTLEKADGTIRIESCLGIFQAEINGLVLENVKADEQLRPFRFGVERVFEKFGVSTGFNAVIGSELPVGSGLASSAASSASLLGGLIRLMDFSLTPGEMVHLVFASEMDIQKRGSISGSACTVLGGVVEMTGNDFERIEDIAAYPHLVVADSKEPLLTAESTGWVKRKLEEDEPWTLDIFDKIEEVAVKGKNALGDKDWTYLGVLMSENHGYLRTLGVSTDKIEKGIEAVGPYVYGSKITGAGGGGCFVSLCGENDTNTVREILERNDFKAFSCRISDKGLFSGENI